MILYRRITTEMRSGRLFYVLLFVAALDWVTISGFDYSQVPPQPRSGEYYALAADQLRHAYENATPFPHVVVNEFFPADLVHEVSASFDLYDIRGGNYDRMAHISRYNAQYLKVERSQILQNDATTFLVNHMMSTEFIFFLESLTGVAGLVADSKMFGAGLHQTLPGGHLAVHLDYNFNDQINMWRRINVFLYLNEEWDVDWGGDLQLWDANMTHAQLAIAPLFNRLVVFEASEYSWHGHPDPLACPPHRSRRSLAMYYYTVVDNPLWERRPRSTLFMPRQGVDQWGPDEWFHTK